MRSKLPFTSLSRDPFFDVQQPKKVHKLAIGSNTNIDKHEILFLTVHNTMGFARETFYPWSRVAFFEGQ